MVLGHGASGCLESGIELGGCLVNIGMVNRLRG